MDCGMRTSNILYFIIRGSFPCNFFFFFFCYADENIALSLFAVYTLYEREKSSCILKWKVSYYCRNNTVKCIVKIRSNGNVLYCLATWSMWYIGNCRDTLLACYDTFYPEKILSALLPFTTAHISRPRSKLTCVKVLVLALLTLVKCNTGKKKSFVTVNNLAFTCRRRSMSNSVGCLYCQSTETVSKVLEWKTVGPKVSWFSSRHSNTSWWSI